MKTRIIDRIEYVSLVDLKKQIMLRIEEIKKCDYCDCQYHDGLIKAFEEILLELCKSPEQNVGNQCKARKPENFGNGDVAVSGEHNTQKKCTCLEKVFSGEKKDGEYVCGRCGGAL